MKLKENETIPNSEFFIMEDGNPIKKNTFEFFKDKKVVLFGYLVPIHQFVQPNIYLDTLITMINTRQKV